MNETDSYSTSAWLDTAVAAVAVAVTQGRGLLEYAALIVTT